MIDCRDPWREPPRMNRKPIVVGLFAASFFWAPLALMIWWRL